MENNNQSKPLDLPKSQLLLQVIPYVTREEVFALKGGTAINFFYQNVPRLSIDIDLCYLPVAPRKESLQEISDAMGRIGEGFIQNFPEATV